MNKRILTIMSLLMLAIALLVAGCTSTNFSENAMLGDYYQVKILDAKDTQGQPVTFVTVVGIVKTKDGKDYAFKQSLYSLGEHKVVERQLSGSYDEAKHTLTIGNLYPMIYDPKTDTMQWMDETYVHLTKDRQGEFDKAMQQALTQRMSK